MCIRKIISKIIHTEKLKLEIIDKIFDIGNCIRFDLINATLQFQSLFAPFWFCFTLFQHCLQPFHANFSLSDLNLPCFFRKIWILQKIGHKSSKTIDESQKSEFSNYWQIINIEFRPLEIISDLKELSIASSSSKLPGKISKNYRYQTNDVSLTPTFGTN